MRGFRITYRPAWGRRLLEDVDADDVRHEGSFLVFRRDVLVLRRPRTVVALRVPAAAVGRVETRCPAQPPDSSGGGAGSCGVTTAGSGGGSTEPGGFPVGG